MGLCGSAKIKVYEFDADEAGLNHKQKKKFDRLCRELQIHEEDITKFWIAVVVLYFCNTE